MTLGEKIKELRQEKGLKQADIANKLGVSTRQYQKYESDEVVPQESTIEKLAEVFSIQKEDLLTVKHLVENKSAVASAKGGTETAFGIPFASWEIIPAVGSLLVASLPYLFSTKKDNSNEADKFLAIKEKYPDLTNFLLTATDEQLSALETLLKK